MDHPYLSDLVLESLRAGILAVLMMFILIRGRNSRFARQRGATAMMIGFGLIFFASLLDSTDEIESLSRFVIIGNTPVEAFLEEIVGYLLGFSLVLYGFVGLVPAIAELEATEVALRESEARFRTVFEMIPDMVGITRLRDGLIIDVNPAYESALGVRREQVVGRTSAEVGAWMDMADRRRMVELLQRDGELRDFEVMMRSLDGGEHDCLLSACVIQLQGEAHILGLVKDITERKQVEASLRESEVRFRLIFQASPDPVVLTRLNGELLDVNEAFVARTGIPREKAIGANSLELGLWSDPARRELFLADLRRHGQIDNFEAEFHGPGATVLIGLLSARLLTVGNQPCILIVIRDVTLEKQVEKSLQEMDRMKSEFISTAAHELRTPLAAMLGYAEFLIDPDNFGAFTEEQKHDFLKEIYEKGEVLTGIIDDLLDISRIESGHGLALDIRDEDPARLLAKLITRFQMHSPRHDLVLDLLPDQGLLVPMDRQRIVQVLENLLSNAIKYSPGGGRVVVSAWVDASDFSVSIRDYGIGMSGEQLAKVFDKFFRADTSNTAIGGLGLGMSIARQIVEAHGGRIWLESRLGEGTTAFFSLPLQRQESV